MSSVFRVLTLSATLSLALSACASIETKGLPKCSGQDRRPLNGDLWQWKDAQPSAWSQVEAEPMEFAAAYAHGRASVMALNQIVARKGAPRWDIATSKQHCR